MKLFILSVANPSLIIDPILGTKTYYKPIASEETVSEKSLNPSKTGAV